MNRAQSFKIKPSQAMAGSGDSLAARLFDPVYLQIGCNCPLYRTVVLLKFDCPDKRIFTVELSNEERCKMSKREELIRFVLDNPELISWLEEIALWIETHPLENPNSQECA